MLRYRVNQDRGDRCHVDGLLGLAAPVQSYNGRDSASLNFTSGLAQDDLKSWSSTFFNFNTAKTDLILPGEA